MQHTNTHTHTQIDNLESVIRTETLVRDVLRPASEVGQLEARGGERERDSPE